MRLFWVFFAVTLLPIASADAQWSSLDQYYDSLQNGCRTDADCVEKNVGNCCGGYPRCVLKQGVPNPAWVSKFCAEQELAGVCGYAKIESCRCAEGRCAEVIAVSGDGVESPVVF